MFDFIERHDRAVFRWGYCALAMLLILMVALYCVFATRYSFAGERLTLSSVTIGEVVMVDRHGNEARLNGSPDLFFEDSTNTVAYRDRVIRCSVDFEDGDYVYTFSDGSVITEPFFQVLYDDESDYDQRNGLTPLQRDEYDLINKMEVYLREGNPTWPTIGLGALALLMMLLGMGQLCFPESWWQWQTMFLVQGGEPTDWAIFSYRAGGMICILLSFCIPFIWLLANR